MSQTQLDWRIYPYDDKGFCADSSQRIPDGAVGALYIIEDDSSRAFGPDRNPGWSLTLTSRDRHGDDGDEIYLGHHLTLGAAKAAAEQHEQTGITPV